ncbi:hypothetical protein UA08_06234 [Talaromyces atroroseus]|uniref:PH domain-containing protein n=1 Tax=Talaromyces atroroseus TaxID=1441469 RepID=A0A225ATV4_TALAT|nr:hypothetical protein UA08_06234 [Talaromyces atroroseus]OKL58366.1 hypothetical protein UA08_06234 [Talaromyces atroroseus]
MRTKLCRAATALSSTRQTACFHCATRTWAIAHPITAHGPPPKAPTPAPEFKHDPRRATTQHKQTQTQTDSSAATRVSQAKSSPLKRRFWKDVHVTENADGYQVLLDTRPVRSPTKAVLMVPNTKRHLAEAIALEWDLLTSAQQALKQHLIPLTSLTTRATDIVREDESGQQQRIRQEIVKTAMRYLDTDTLLCWVPEKELASEKVMSGPGETGTEGGTPTESLRDMQMRVAQGIIGFLTRTIWPGVELKPVLDENSIMPVSQSQKTLDTIQSWIWSLPAYELAGLERAILASKSLLVAARLVVEWGEHFANLQQTLAVDRERFGVEEAAQASSLEVMYQTGMWGEVEDTHDVDREDLRRQLGSVVLLANNSPPGPKAVATFSFPSSSQQLQTLPGLPPSLPQYPYTRPVSYSYNPSQSNSLFCFPSRASRYAAAKMSESSVGHKRSKSALARSLLHRVQSKNESRDDNNNNNSNNSNINSNSNSNGNISPTSTTASSSFPSFPESQHNRHSSLSLTKTRSNRRIDTTMESPTASGDISSSIAEERSSSSPPETAPAAATSIEQSVKAFRLFEILRSGDTTAISKAIKEAKDQSTGAAAASSSSGTTILHLAIQCADLQVVEYVVASGPDVDINARDREGNTPLHLASQLGRDAVVQALLAQPQIDDSVANYRGQTALDVARTPEIFEKLQLARSVFIDVKAKQIQDMVVRADYNGLEKLLEEPRVLGNIDVNALDLVTDTVTAQSGGTLLHEGARKKDTKLLEILLMHGADPFRRDKKGKLPQDVTKDDKTRAIVKKSPAAIIAQRGIQERAILGNVPSQASANRAASSEVTLAGKDAREMKGYLKKWTNYTSGFKLRWFVLEDGVLSYYKHQDDAGSACRGAISMRIARLHMDAQDKTRFEIQGKSSVKYHLKANHVVEAKRWFWALNNAIQWAKDEAKEEERRRTRESEFLHAKMQQVESRASEGPASEFTSSATSRVNSRGAGGSALVTTDSKPSFSRVNTHTSRTAVDSSIPGDDEAASAYGSYTQSVAHTIDLHRTNGVPAGIDEEPDYEDYNDYASSHDAQPTNKDAFYITAQSAKLQLDLLSNVSASLKAQKDKTPELTVSDPVVDQALSTYESAVGSLNDLLACLSNISRDRDAYWQYRLDKESDMRKMWEESMARIVQEHEELQHKVGESEEKRRKTKKALKEVLENTPKPLEHEDADKFEEAEAEAELEAEKATAKPIVTTMTLVGDKAEPVVDASKKGQTISEYADLAESDSDDDDAEFFDAISSEDDAIPAEKWAESGEVDSNIADLRSSKLAAITPAFTGYEDPVRQRLKMDQDDRPKLSLWSILKSMIGKDMTKMTLPVSFNEPTSLLQRVAEDMEYADLLDVAADRSESLERLLYVAAYAISEYASTIGRVAKPFNPLLGETFEYVRPDKQYRFYVEQVSHHPPIGAAWAESPKWEYYGESALKSKFYGKSFDINLLGTWFCKLRPINGEEELYTWKKVTSSVIGIITGNPTVDNYGPMEVKNWKTGEVCYLDFKARGWKASSAYQVSGKLVDAAGVTRWTIGGRWNDKIFARPTTTTTPPQGTESTIAPDESSKPILLWQANPRPTGIPFNLTPFVLTLNAIPDRLRPFLPPTDTRLRPDQRAMEDGEYDFAASEKHRVEEKQRAKRREREMKGEEFLPKWFQRAKCPITGEEYWQSSGQYWKCREVSDWSACEDIF